MIQAIPIAMTDRGRDRLAWVDNPRDNFDLKSAYSIALNSITSSPFTTSWIWKSKILPKIKTFLWRCAYDSISVKVCLARRGEIDEVLYPICRGESELVLHAPRDCAWVKAVWLQLGVETTNQAFWMIDL